MWNGWPFSQEQSQPCGKTMQCVKQMHPSCQASLPNVSLLILLKGFNHCAWGCCTSQVRVLAVNSEGKRIPFYLHLILFLWSMLGLVPAKINSSLTWMFLSCNFKPQIQFHSQPQRFLYMRLFSVEWGRGNHTHLTVNPEFMKIS